MEECDDNLVRVFEEITDYFRTYNKYKDSNFVPANKAIDLIKK